MIIITIPINLKTINSMALHMKRMKILHMKVSKDIWKRLLAIVQGSIRSRGVYGALKHNRKLLISPTASGKSLMIYSIVRYYHSQGEKILLVLPTTSLVEQLYKDFEDYGWDSESYCHKIYFWQRKE